MSSAVEEAWSTSGAENQDPDTPGPGNLDPMSVDGSPSISIPPMAASDDHDTHQDQDTPAEYSSHSHSGSRSRPAGLPDVPPGNSDLVVSHRGEKQIKPNKVYIGGLPEHTRQEDLRNCFSKIGNIVAIELKIGYGFVEFDSREAAELSVSKYHEGYFMGNKIRVELSKGGGRTAKYTGDPGACFKCGQMGHWARECPHHPGPTSNNQQQRRSDAPLINRIQRDYPPASATTPPPASAPARDSRFDYPAREYRRPASPPPSRDYYPPPSNRGRYDDHRYTDRDRDRDRHPPPPSDYRSRHAEPASHYRGTPSVSYSGDRYRSSSDRYGHQPPPPPGRARTPPRYRDDYAPPRDYDYRARPTTPPRYAYDYPPRSITPDRYRHRSASPPPRSAPAGYDYSGSQNGGYPSTPPGPPPARSSRDYPPRSGGRDVPPDSYRRA